MIRLEDINFIYTGTKKNEGGLNNMNLSAKTGECILLCGRSGCGKTTVTKLINGLIPNYFPGELSGSVKVGDLDTFQTPMYEIAKKIGSVFQNPRTQFFNIDVDSEIAFGIENEAVAQDELHQRFEDTLDALKIRHLQGRNIFELSGGEKQKIAFASVYAMNPDVYLLDEPSSNLDMSAIRDLKEYLHIIKKQGKTIVIAEHRLWFLMDLVDKIIYMADGKIQGIDTPKSFCEMSRIMRNKMGLRAVDLKGIAPLTKKIAVSPAVLEIKEAALFYKKQVVMEHINLKASKGEIIGIMGHNGAGKTTFLRALCGLHREYSGDFLWEGIVQSPKERMKRSYMVMQDVNYELFADSVESECTIGIKNPNPDLVDKTLEELDLIAFRDKHPNTLSGGQKQRVAVAVSMVCGKELLVFDEPTSGLDYDSMDKVAKLILKLAGEKIIFVVTHDYEFACQVCTRWIHFKDGAITDDLVSSEDHESKIRTLFGR